jgi:hypothetical protein
MTHLLERYNGFEWTVQRLEDGWYYFDWQGNPYGPFETEEAADEGLDWYAMDYENRDD